MGRQLPEDFIAAVRWVRAFDRAEREAAAWGDLGRAIVPPYGCLDELNEMTLRW